MEEVPGRVTQLHPSRTSAVAAAPRGARQHHRGLGHVQREARMRAAATSTVRFRLAGVFALACWLLWPSLSAHAAAPRPTSYAPSAHSAEEGASSHTESGGLSGARQRVEETAGSAPPAFTGAPGTEAGGVHEFACREGHCNRLCQHVHPETSSCIKGVLSGVPTILKQGFVEMSV